MVDCMVKLFFLSRIEKHCVLETQILVKEFDSSTVAMKLHQIHIEAQFKGLKMFENSIIPES